MYERGVPEWERSENLFLAEATDFPTKRPDRLWGAPSRLLPVPKMYGAIPSFLHMRSWRGLQGRLNLKPQGCTVKKKNLGADRSVTRSQELY